MTADVLAAFAAWTAAFLLSCVLAIALTHDRPARILARLLAPLLGDGKGTAWNPDRDTKDTP